MKKQKAKVSQVFQIGGSCCVSLPHEWCQENGVKVGGVVLKVTDKPNLTIIPLSEGNSNVGAGL